MKLCILRLSALGDVTHTLTVVRRLQDQRPDTEITWIIGRLEHRLLKGVEGVEFIEFNKNDGLNAYRDLRKALRGRRFDVLLQMQVAMRANFASACIRATRKIGYDPARSKDLHGLFVKERIAAEGQQHVLDAMQSFLAPLDIEATTLRWDLPITDADRDFAAQHVDASRRTLCISPVSSHKLRNWHVAGYAAVADHAIRTHGMQVILTGGPSEFELDFASAISSEMEREALDLTGRDTLKQLAALLEKADLLLAPDTGPMHIANAMGTDVIGLHAASNPRRSGPYSSLAWCVDRYPEATAKFLRKQVDELRWGAKVEKPGAMDLVTVDMVKSKLDAWVAAQDLSRS